LLALQPGRGKPELPQWNEAYSYATTKGDSWDAAAQVRASDRWATASAAWNKSMTDALLAAAALGPDSVLLDLAAGSGDPALTVAERFVSVRVIALDKSLTGLLLANTLARQLGLGSKIACISGDAHAIPMARNSVDRITCPLRRYVL